MPYMLHAYAADIDPSDNPPGRFHRDTAEYWDRADAHASMLHRAASGVSGGIALPNGDTPWLTLAHEQVDPYAEADPYGIVVAIPCSLNSELARDMIDRAFCVLRPLQAMGLKPYDEERRRPLDLEADRDLVADEYGRQTEYESGTRRLLAEVCAVCPTFRVAVEEDMAEDAPHLLGHVVMGAIMAVVNEMMVHGGAEGERQVSRLLDVFERAYGVDSPGPDDLISLSFLESIASKATYPRLWTMIKNYPKLNADLQRWWG